MKKLFFFLMLGIAFASCDGLNPIDEVVKHTIVATYDENVTISPASVVVENGGSVTLDVITKTGYTSTVKVNDKVVSLTSSKLTLSNVVADTKIEATSRKIKQYTITLTIDSNGTLGGSPATTVVDSGKPFVMNIFAGANFGYVIDKFKVNGVEKTWTPSYYDFGKVNCDIKVEFTTTKKKEEVIDPYFFGIKWRMDSIYARVPGLAGYEEYSLYLYVYYGNMVYYFFSSGNSESKWDGELVCSDSWSVDKTTNPNILSWGGRKRKVEVRTNKKLVISYIDEAYVPAVEFKETFIPEP